MTDIEGRIRTETKALQVAAEQRWVERSGVRERGLSRIASQGIGAADTQSRQLEWTAREMAKSQASLAAVERIIGPTVDYTRFAPSTRAAAAAQPVARIVELPAPGHVPRAVATGFLVADRLLLTNHHVFGARADAAGCGANFGYVEDEHGLNEGCCFELDPDYFFISDKEFDFALVGVKPTGQRGEVLKDQGSLRLLESPAKILTGQPVNIVEHPKGGPRQFVITNNKVVDILAEGFLHYEADTEPGSSGSPVFNSEWELVGLHHTGVPRRNENGQWLTRAGTVYDPNRDLDSDIDWVANECVRVSAIVRRMRSLQAANEAEQGLLDALLAATADTAHMAAIPGTAVLQSTSALQALGTSLGGAVLNFLGPVTIQLPASPAASSPVAAPAIVSSLADADGRDLVAQERALVFDSDYGQRTGYDQDFLGKRVPLPSAKSALQPDMYTVADYKTYYEEYRNVPKLNLPSMKDDEPLVLDYHHFSLTFHKKYRMCLWTASNCDYRPLERQDRRKRAELGGENWQLDPRVPAALQLTDADVYRPLKRIDRGHIVRREDNAWGTAGLATEYSNSDTYHWTNCTPQHEAFNQAHPQDKSGQTIYQGVAVRGLWGQFENDLALAIKRGGGQASVFAGPVLNEDGDAIDWGNGEVAIPKKFWKVFVVPETTARRTRLLAYAYIFDQTPAVRKFGLTYEGVELPQFVRDRVTLADITEQTGVLFPAEVLAAEKLASNAVPA